MIFVILWILMSVIVVLIQLNVADYLFFGFPLKYSASLGEVPQGSPSSFFYPLNLAVDIIAWLTVSVALTYASFKIKK